MDGDFLVGLVAGYLIVSVAVVFVLLGIIITLSRRR